MISDQDAENPPWEGRAFPDFSVEDAGHPQRKGKLQSTPQRTEVTSEWTKDPNRRAKTVTLRRKQGKLHDIGLGSEKVHLMVFQKCVHQKTTE